MPATFSLALRPRLPFAVVESDDAFMRFPRPPLRACCAHLENADAEGGGVVPWACRAARPTCVLVRSRLPRAHGWRARNARAGCRQEEEMSLAATARSIPGTLRQEVVIDGRRRLITDEPKHLGGDGSGPAPHELFPAALASCVSTTLVMYARPYEGVGPRRADGRGRVRQSLDAAQVRDRGPARRRPRCGAARAPCEGRSLVSPSTLDQHGNRVRRTGPRTREPTGYEAGPRLVVGGRRRKDRGNRRCDRRADLRTC